MFTRHYSLYARNLFYYFNTDYLSLRYFSKMNRGLTQPTWSTLKREMYCPQNSASAVNFLSPVQLRAFIKLPGGFDLGNKKKDYAERRLLGYSMEQMFKVVAEVEHYKDFVPYCKQSLVTSKSSSHMRANLVVGFPPLVESYTSSITLTPPNLVKSVCTEGKLFNHLLTIWKFSPGLKANPQTCLLDFSVSFEFRSAIHSHFSHMFFDKIVVQMVNAFLTEAQRRYGPASIAGQRPQIISRHS